MNDEDFATLLKVVLWQRGMEGHTRRGQTLIVRPKAPKKKLIVQPVDMKGKP